MSEVTLPPIDTAAQTAPAPTTQESSFRKWAGLGVLSLGLAIIIIDTTLLNVSLATIIKDLHTDLKSLQWVITAYALVLAALTITGGRLGDLFGRKRMFMLGAIIFAAGSFLASISTNLPVLLLGESIIEGIGAALMMPATAALVVANFHGKDRATAFGIWGAVAGASSAIGPLLGGYLTTHFSWRWGFRINIFVAALVVLGSLWLINESEDDHKPTLDWFGVILSSLGLLSIVYAIIESSAQGWWHVKTVASIFGHALNLGGYSIVPFSLVLGIILLGIFAWWENRIEKSGKTPLVSLQLFKNTQFTASAFTMSIVTLGMSGLIFALPVFLQTVKTLDAFHTGLALLPMSVALFIAAPLVGGLSKKIAPKYFILAGLLIDVVGAFLLRATLKADMTLTQLILPLGVYGLGLGMVMGPLSNMTLSAVPLDQAGEASGVNNTFRQVGSTLGAAIIGAAVLTSLTGHLTQGIEQSKVIPGSAKQAIITNISSADSNIEFDSGSSTQANTPDFIKAEMKGLVEQSSTHAAKDAYVYAALFAFLAFLVAQFLPKTPGSIAEHNNITLKRILTLVLAIAAVGGAIALLNHDAKAVISTGNVISGAPVATPDGGTVTQPQTNPPVATTVPTPTAPKPTTPPAPTVQEYQNSILGFSTTIDSDWAVTVDNTTYTASFNHPTQGAYSIESLKIANETLETIKIQLQNSPGVSNLTTTTYLNEPALTFTMSGTYKTGIALIHNGKIYYLFGQSLTGGPLATLKLL